jgi:hypothetical protein
MARGKYATRAANARAETAGERADRLEVALAEERSARAREVAALKTEVQRLAGQLTTAVMTMAAAEVERVRAESVAQIEAIRSESAQRGLDAMRLLEGKMLNLSPKIHSDLEDLLVPDARVFGEAIRQEGGLNRSQARWSRSELRSDLHRDEASNSRARLVGAMREKLANE